MQGQLEGDFATRLRGLMADQGIGGEKLAILSGVNERQIRGYRTGAHEPRDPWGRPTANAWKLARALGVPVDELVPPTTTNGDRAA